MLLEILLTLLVILFIGVLIYIIQTQADLLKTKQQTPIASSPNSGETTVTSSPNSSETTVPSSPTPDDGAPNKDDVKLDSLEKGPNEVSPEKETTNDKNLGEPGDGPKQGRTN